MHALRKHASPSPQGKSKPVGQWRTKACLTLTCGRSYRQREPCVRNEQRAMRTFRARQVSFTCFEVSGSPHDRRNPWLGKTNPVGQIQILHKHCIGRCPTWMSYRQLVIAIRTSALGIKTWESASILLCIFHQGIQLFTYAKLHHGCWLVVSIY